MTSTCTISSNSQTSWTCTNNSNFLASFFSNFWQSYLTIFPFPISDKTFQTTNGNSFFSIFIYFSNSTFSLTLFFLRTNTTTNCRKKRCFFDSINSSFKFAFCNFTNKLWNIDVYRATFHTKRFCTLQTSVCFYNSLFCRISECNFIHFSSTFFCITSRHFHLRNSITLFCSKLSVSFY